MEPLRCWSLWDGLTAMSDSDTLYCEGKAKHDGACWAVYGQYQWDPDECSPDRGPTGRLSVALRLIECASRIMVIDHIADQVSEYPEMFRAMAARLRAGSGPGAAADLATLRELIEDGEKLAVCEADDSPTALVLRGNVAALLDVFRAAAEFLRPFAGMEADR